MINPCIFYKMDKLANYKLNSFNKTTNLIKYTFKNYKNKIYLKRIFG